MKKGKTALLVCITLTLALNLLAIEEKEVLEFFERYQELAKNFDTASSELYSDGAKIHTSRKVLNGEKKVMELSGKQLKEMLPKILPIAKKRGDISEYSNAEITIHGNKARIKANRYSVLKNYKDTGYYLVVEKADDGNLLIIEEYTETQPQTEAWKKSDGELSSLLKHQENQIKGHLPLMVDDDTRLDSVAINGATFQYQYTLINYAIEDLDLDATNDALTSIVKPQSCETPNLRQVLNMGGTISYLYNDKNGDEITTINITSDSCD